MDFYLATAIKISGDLTCRFDLKVVRCLRDNRALITGYSGRIYPCLHGNSISDIHVIRMQNLKPLRVGVRSRKLQSTVEFAVNPFDTFAFVEFGIILTAGGIFGDFTSLFLMFGWYG